MDTSWTQIELCRATRRRSDDRYIYESIGLKVLIYSGDADSVVNFLGTERWIGDEGLNLTPVGDWHAWFGPDKQLAGYVETYEGLTFKTVKGAGHMVAAVRPLHALYMFECFVFGQAKCDNEFTYPKDRLEYLSGEHSGHPVSQEEPSAWNAMWHEPWPAMKHEKDYPDRNLPGPQDLSWRPTHVLVCWIAAFALAGLSIVTVLVATANRTRRLTYRPL